MRLVATALLLSSALAHADEELLEAEPPPPTPFDQGRMRLAIFGGTTSNFDKRYFAIGGGFGYFVVDGLELGVAAVHQFGDGPSISQVQPGVRYVVKPLVGRMPVIPYVGAFYNHWFIGDGISDVDAVGGRAGLIYLSGRVMFGFGVAVERVVSDCTTSSGEEDCWDVYPDFSISLSL
jgi:hypothetical protein